MSDDGLTLEKLKIEERLRSVESHIVEGQANREALMIGFKDMKTSIDKLNHTIFGNGVEGMIHRVDKLNKLAEAFLGVAKRIFWLMLSTIIIASLPNIASFVSKVLHK